MQRQERLPGLQAEWWLLRALLASHLSANVALLALRVPEDAPVCAPHEGAAVPHLPEALVVLARAAPVPRTARSRRGRSSPRPPMLLRLGFHRIILLILGKACFSAAVPQIFHFLRNHQD